MGGIVKCGDCMKRDKEETSRDEQEEIGSEEETKRDEQEEIGREEETSRDEQEEIGREEETSRDEQEEIGSEEETKRDEQEEIGSEEETKRDEEGEIGSEEETKRDEQEEIGSEEETKRDEQEEIGREEETTRDNSPTEREEWESIIRELISELKSSDEEEEIGLPNSNPFKMKALVSNVKSPVFRRTPLHVAVLNKKEDIVKYLLQEQDKLEYCVSLGVNWHKDVYGLTPLHYAVLMEDKELVKMLVESSSYSASVNVGDFSFRTPLHLACARRYRQGEDVVAILLSNSNVDLNAKDCCGYTPLHWAVHVGASGVVTLLLKRNIKLDEKDVDGKTAVHHVHAAARSTAGDVQRRETMLEVEGVLTSDPRVEKRIDRMYRDRQVYVDAANAILVGAALIASVTYGGWLQPPLGDHDDHTRRIARIFWGFNSLSFSFAIAAVMAGAGAVLPVADLFIEDAVARVRDWLAVTAVLLLVSAAFVLGAFGAAGFASMTTVGDLEANMTTTMTVGGAVWLLIALVFLRGLCRVSNVWPTRRLLKGCAGLFYSSSSPLRARNIVTLPLLEHLALSEMAVDISVLEMRGKEVKPKQQQSPGEMQSGDDSQPQSEKDVAYALQQRLEEEDREQEATVRKSSLSIPYHVLDVLHVSFPSYLRLTLLHV
ncbi:hypothetical protein AXG93_3986s1160 [Marchantia polymorpha subsp. ruderalis]|uniref:PGG domain-containing protein n=1 Tax=Marchantia polymorpha subsp. ruderalis TaxID=1480154 RepID=A0A176VS49_MARPO|nr:hypothetical protein AXG93_3986s1160 [Marchantia polymorpha subsp. ruderalis]